MLIVFNAHSADIEIFEFWLLEHFWTRLCIHHLILEPKIRQSFPSTGVLILLETLVWQQRQCPSNWSNINLMLHCEFEFWNLFPKSKVRLILKISPLILIIGDLSLIQNQSMDACKHLLHVYNKVNHFESCDSSWCFMFYSLLNIKNWCKNHIKQFPLRLKWV